MSDDLDKVQQEAKRLQKELNEKGLSRRGLLNRFNFMGVGFGAAYLLGARRADALTRSDDKPDVKIKSTNPALNDIIQDGQAPGAQGSTSVRSRRRGSGVGISAAIVASGAIAGSGAIAAGIVGGKAAASASARPREP